MDGVSPFLPSDSLFTHPSASVPFISRDRCAARCERSRHMPQLHHTGVWSVSSPLHDLLQALPISAHRVTQTKPCVTPKPPHCGLCWTPEPCPHSAGALHLRNSPEPQKACLILPFHRTLFFFPSSMGFPSIVPVPPPRGYPILWAMAYMTVRFCFPVIGLFHTSCYPGKGDTGCAEWMAGQWEKQMCQLRDLEQSGSELKRK